MRTLAGLGSAALALAIGCAGPQHAAGPKHARAAECEYDATLLGMEAAMLEVEVRCRGRELTGFSTAEAAAAPHLRELGTLDGTPLVARGGYRWDLPEASSATAIRYRIDLGALAKEVDHFDVAQRVGRSLVAPASTWLLRPEPTLAGLPVTVRVATPPGVDFATGLKKSGSAYSLQAHEIRTATYSVFGKFAREQIALPSLAGGGKRSELDVVVLDARLGVPASVLRRWLEESALAVSDFFGGFPVDRALLMIRPVRSRDGVLFGKVLPESAPGIALLVGEHTDRNGLYADWVLIHELFHLGFPSFNGEGKWLDEGLATYYEPLIRARRGWKSEQEVWAEFVRAMPQGLPAATIGGLEKASSFREIYWGGAIVALLADLEARKRSGGARGLEEGLRAVLRAGGSASEVWTLSQAVDLIDSRYAAPLLGPLAAAHGHAGNPLDLERLWTDLGIRVTPHGVELDDGAPLAAVRKAIVYGQKGKN
jgi:hypothetical protein